MALYKQPGSRYWHAKYTDADGVIRRRSTRCRDKSSAQAVYSRWLAEVERLKAGIVTASEVAASHHAMRPLAEHLADYEAKHRAAGHDERHIRESLVRLHRVFKNIGARTIRDLSRASVERWLADHAGKGLSARTRNLYRSTLVAFVQWLSGRRPYSMRQLKTRL